MDLLYAAAGAVAWPWLVRKSLRTGKYQRGLAQRFGLGEEPLPAARDRARRKTPPPPLRQRRGTQFRPNPHSAIGSPPTPALTIVVSTTTDTGWDRALKLYGPAPAAKPAADTPPPRVYPVRFPFDFSFAMERLFDRVQPDAVALVELETWPNFLEIAHDRRIPVVIINGRISERSFPRYRLIRPAMAAMLRRITWIGAQTDTIATRFRSLGAPHVEVIPTLKYDNAALAEHVPGQDALAAAMGLTPDHQLFVGGSTGPGEEEPLLDAYTALREKFPNLRLALVPRHPEVVPQVIPRHRTPRPHPHVANRPPRRPARLSQKSKIKNKK